MFTKRVWFDKRHLAEVFLMDDVTTIGTLVAYEGAVVLINPTSHMLSALYQESKLKRLLGIRGIILTSASVSYARGVCAFVNYSRVLGRKTPISIMMPSDQGAPSGVEFISRCCHHLVATASFELVLSQLSPGERGEMGKGEVVFVQDEGRGPLLMIQTTRGRTLHYYDGDHRGAPMPHRARVDRPDVVIREVRGRKPEQTTGDRLVLLDDDQR